MSAASIDRVCVGCGTDISDRRPQATTCGSSRCRMRRAREKRRHLDQAAIAAIPSQLSSADVSDEDEFVELEVIASSNGLDGVLIARDGCRKAKGPRRELAGV